jgi:hypothetical protein
MMESIQVLSLEIDLDPIVIRWMEIHVTKTMDLLAINQTDTCALLMI